MMKENEDCSWEEMYLLNSVVVNGEEELESLELREIDSIVVGFTAPFKDLMRIEIPELVITQ